MRLPLRSLSRSAARLGAAMPTVAAGADVDSKARAAQAGRTVRLTEARRSDEGTRIFGMRGARARGEKQGEVGDGMARTPSPIAAADPVEFFARVSSVERLLHCSGRCFSWIASQALVSTARESLKQSQSLRPTRYPDNTSPSLSCNQRASASQQHVPHRNKLTLSLGSPTDLFCPPTALHPARTSSRTEHSHTAVA